MCDDAQLASAPWRPLSVSCYAPSAHSATETTHLLFRFLFHRRVAVAAATFTGTQPSALASTGELGGWVVEWVVDAGYNGAAPNTASNLELAVREPCHVFVLSPCDGKYLVCPRWQEKVSCRCTQKVSRRSQRSRSC